MYDIFYIGDKQHPAWQEIKIKFSVVKQADTFEQARTRSLTAMFWVVYDDVVLDKDWNFDYKVPEWDRKYVHVFLNGDSYNGVSLHPKGNVPSTKELQHRFFVNSKQISIVASTPRKYDIFYTGNYVEYQDAFSSSATQMFWCVPKDVEITDQQVFETHIPFENLFDKKINHVYKNGKYQDGIILCSKHAEISKREWKYGFLTNKKEIDIQVSKPKPFDIVFISYDETNAETHYKALQQRFPHAKRVHGVKGIHQAHIAAAKLCDTNMFWVVDADAVVLDDFEFDYQVPRWEQDVVHVWRSRNPITGMEYGYGGVKLLPTELTLNMVISTTDMTTTISSKFKAVDKVSNITAFNTTAFNTWKSAFRESVKLTLNNDKESQERLQAWLHPVPDAYFRHDAKQGAEQGQAYALDNSENLEALAKINDFDWLKEHYENRT